MWGNWIKHAPSKAKASCELKYPENVNKGEWALTELALRDSWSPVVEHLNLSPLTLTRNKRPKKKH